MALETVVFNCNDLHSMVSSWAYEEDKTMESYMWWGVPASPVGAPEEESWDVIHTTSSPPPLSKTAVAGGRRKRRRTMKSSKNKEEVENQRMTHIAVERNRRRQMNDYLSVLRSLMPASYAQRGDQASIIGGAINFVKELEHLLQSLEAQKCLNNNPTTTTTTTSSDVGSASPSPPPPQPFAGFFTYPQYSTYSVGGGASDSAVAAADIEVTMVESHANVKVLSRRQPKQLLKMFVGLHNLRLTTLHLNVTTVHPMALYSFSLKVEDDCQLTSVDEIATAVYQVLGKIQEESN
ncbi:Transcription factor bHLH94 [Acorus calamus]|uniref:Transcription factor bHLH94 n=1 Tax=Acorus calamus TaxID=4465 RepID=A0AAV9DM59_ACOCL|nr:Transcription factor bHLH94 [Acorus calamus]